MIFQIEYFAQQRLNLLWIHVQVDADNLLVEPLQVADLLDQFQEGGLGLTAGIYAFQVAAQQVVVGVLCV